MRWVELKDTRYHIDMLDPIGEKNQDADLSFPDLNKG